MKACLYTVLLLFYFCALHAQFDTQYTPWESKLSAIQDHQKALQERLNQDLQQLPKGKKDKIKELKQIYEDRHTNLNTKLEEGHFIFDDQVIAFFDSILQKIYRNNPSIPADEIRVLISRYTWPNASCWGEGTIVFNLGLLRHLENEGQVAFVLCHELAHYMENHVNNAIHLRLDKLYSKETQKRIKKLSKQEENVYDEALDLLKEYVYDSRRHSRLHEVEADSLGLVYLKNTSYNLSDAIRCLEILDTIDEHKKDAVLALHTVLHTTAYPFKERWLKTENNLYVYSEEDDFDVDSLKTHPNCTKRIKILHQHPKFSTAEKDNKSTQSQRFKRFLLAADFEMVESSFLLKNYGQCFYQCVLLLNQFPENGYLWTRLSDTMHQIYQAQKEHELGKYVPLPSHKHPEKYKQVLTFIHNLRLSELSKIGFYTLQNRLSSFEEDEDFLYTYWQWAVIRKELTTQKQVESLYKQRFPKGIYTKKIFSNHK